MSQVHLPSMLRAGLIVGAFDAIAAIVHAYGFRGTTPGQVFRYVASGALGPAAREGGAGTALLGLGFHFFIAVCWTGLFFLLWPRIRTVSARPIVAGPVYGLFVWAMMNFVVVPLSRIGPVPLRLAAPTVAMVLIHMFVIGWPMARFAAASAGRA